MTESQITNRFNKTGILSVLILAALTYFANGAVRLCLPVLFKEIAIDLNLSLVNIGFIWGMDPLAGVFVALPAGLLADRFGVKKTLTILCISEGILGALRGFSFDSISLTIIMFLFGLTAAAMPSVVPKAISSQFKGQKLGISQSLLGIASSLGSMSGTMLSATIVAPLLGGWRNSLFLYGVPIFIMGFMWLFFGKKQEKSETTETNNGVSFKQSIFHIIRIKRIWIIGFISLCGGAAFIGITGYLALYLKNIGWEAVSADLSVTMVIGLSMIGSIPLVLLAYRLGSQKNALMLGYFISAVAMGFLSIAHGQLIWLLIGIVGLLWGAINPLYVVAILESKDVGPKYAGTALGLQSTLSMIGGFLSPPIGNSLAGLNPGFPFLFWAALYVIAFAGFAFLKD
jgi:MFS family permease